MKERLTKYAKNTYSQFGEDGILEKIFQIIGEEAGLAVEFGAWDGLYHSNTGNLWMNEGWRAVLIERERDRFEKLSENTKGRGCVCIHASVEPEGENSLESILDRHNIEGSPDLLSVDIDGDDYYILNGLKNLKPRVVVCEYNPTIPPETVMVAEKGSHFGSSAGALESLMKKKGYFLASATDTNCIFVRDEYRPLFGEFEIGSLDLAPRNHLTYLVSDYDGNYAASRNLTYGFRKPSRQRLAIGDLVYLEDKTGLTGFLVRLKNFFKRRLIPVASRDVKFETVEKYRKIYNPKILVETGTYQGKTVRKAIGKYKHIYSIELDWRLYDRARKLFEPERSVTILQGDSSKVLPELLRRIEEPCLFWLDGHYSGGVTAKGDKATPIEEELEAILRHKVENHVILIDDARHFTGAADYPTIETLGSLARDRYMLAVEGDIVVLTPKK